MGRFAFALDGETTNGDTIVKSNESLRKMLMVLMMLMMTTARGPTEGIRGMAQKLEQTFPHAPGCAVASAIWGAPTAPRCDVGNKTHDMTGKPYVAHEPSGARFLLHLRCFWGSSRKPPGFQKPR